jgi:hypothetical protein
VTVYPSLESTGAQGFNPPQFHQFAAWPQSIMTNIKLTSGVQPRVSTMSAPIGLRDQQGGYAAAIDGQVMGPVVLDKSCGPAWKHARDLGLPTSAANGTMSRLPKRRDSPTEIEPGMNQ